MGKNFFSVIFYSFYIVEGNYIEFKKTIEAYVEAANSDEFLFDSEKHMDLHISGGREIARHIHNYAAACQSLVDHARRIHDKLKEDTAKDIRDFASDYQSRLDEHLKNTFENAFVGRLRNYVQHKEVPVPVLHLKTSRIEEISADSENLLQMVYSFEFNSNDIRDFDWKQLKEYINSNSSVPIVEIIDKHFNIVKEFYLWVQFRDNQLHPYASSDVKNMTFEEFCRLGAATRNPTL